MTLLDPLIESYLKLPKCRYSRDSIKTHTGDHAMPIAQLFACPIERQCPSPPATT